MTDYIKISINLSPARETSYLEALRDHFNGPTLGWSRLIGKLLREFYSIYCETKKEPRHE